MLPGLTAEPFETMFRVWRGYWHVVGVTVVVALAAETVTATGVVAVFVVLLEVLLWVVVVAAVVVA